MGLFLWTLVAGLLTQNLVVIPVMSTAISFEDQKNYYYSPDPATGTPPSGSYGSPATPSHGSIPTPTPSHGSTPTPSHGSGGGYGTPTTPSHTPTPSHGSGGGYGTPTAPSHGSGGHHDPPSNCGNPPSGGHHLPSPAPPTSGGGGGGGYSRPPPTSGGSTPSTPTIVPPPSTPTIIPGTPSIPGISVPTPPFDPSSPPFSGTCNFWSSHPGLIWGIFGWWGTLGNAFGTSSLPGFGSTTMSLPEALSNTRPDGFGALYREGTASLLNSMVDKRFPFTTQQVKDHFAHSVGSNKAAAAQAHVFKLANEGRLKPRSA